jgi:hypothetical protein
MSGSNMSLYGDSSGPSVTSNPAADGVDLAGELLTSPAHYYWERLRIEKGPILARQKLINITSFSSATPGEDDGSGLKRGNAERQVVRGRRAGRGRSVRSAGP